MEKIGLYLLILTLTLDVYLCVVLYRREAIRRVPFFFAYNLCSIITQVGDFILVVLKHSFAYFFFYWISDTVLVILSFMALYETFHWVFRNFYNIAWFRYAFPVTGILMLGIAFVRSLLLPAPDLHRVVASVITLEIAVSFLQVGIFALFLLLVWFFHMRSRQHAFGIALGFGILAAGDLMVFLLRSEFGTNFNPIIEITRPIAYSIALLIWLTAFIPPQPDHPLSNWASQLTPEEMLAELREYSRAVKGVLRR